MLGSSETQRNEENRLIRLFVGLVSMEIPDVNGTIRTVTADNQMGRPGNSFIIARRKRKRVASTNPAQSRPGYAKWARRFCKPVAYVLCMPIAPTNQETFLLGTLNRIRAVGRNSGFIAYCAGC